MQPPFRRRDGFQGFQQPGQPLGVPELARIDELHGPGRGLGGGGEERIIVPGPGDDHFLRRQSVEPLDVLFLGRTQRHGGIQAAAPAQHLIAQVGAVLKLTQVRSVAGRHDGDIREKAPREGADQPEVMGVDDIRPETGHRVSQHPRKNRFVDFQFARGQVDKPGAGVGHDIRHAGDMERDVAAVEPDKAALFQRDAVAFDAGAGLNPCDHEILMAAGGRLPHHGLQVNPAAGGVRPLTEHMENFQFWLRFHDCRSQAAMPNELEPLHPSNPMVVTFVFMIHNIPDYRSIHKPL